MKESWAWHEFCFVSKTHGWKCSILDAYYILKTLNFNKIYANVLFPLFLEFVLLHKDNLYTLKVIMTIDV